MRKMIGMVLVLALVGAACGDDDAADPGALDSCEAIADAAVDILQDTIDIMDDMSMEELAALGESEETPEVFKEVEETGQALEARATEIGCSEEEMNTLLAARAENLSAESTFGQFIIEGLRSGEGGFFEG